MDVYDDDDVDDAYASFGFITIVRDGDKKSWSSSVWTSHVDDVEERQVVRSTKEADANDAGDRGRERR